MDDAPPPASDSTTTPPPPPPPASSPIAHRPGQRQSRVQGGFIPEMMHQISRVPGFRNFEVIFRCNFGDDMDDRYDRYYYNDYHPPPFRHMAQVQQSRNMIQGAPPPSRRRLQAPSPVYNYGPQEPPMGFDHHHHYHAGDYDYGPYGYGLPPRNYYGRYHG